MSTNNFNNLPKMGHHADQNLQLSFDLPQDWQIGSNQYFQLFLVAPTEADYQTVLGINSNILESGTSPMIDQIFEASRQEEIQKYNKYQAISTAKLNINGYYGLMRQFDWLDPNYPIAYCQLVAAMLGESNRIYIANGNCLKSQAPQDLPVLEQVIRSFKPLQLPA